MTHKDLGCSKKLFRKALAACESRRREMGFAAAVPEAIVNGFVRNYVTGAKCNTYWARQEALYGGSDGN